MQKSRSVSLAALSAMAMMAGIGHIPSNSMQETSLKPGTSATQTNGVNKSTPNRAADIDRTLASIFGRMVPASNHKRPPGPGWTNKHVQRMARKRRAVKANRKNHR